MKYENRNDSDEEASSDGWINWFCDIEGHEFFVDVDEDFIRDSFNLYGLKNLIQRWIDLLQRLSKYYP